MIHLFYRNITYVYYMCRRIFSWFWQTVPSSLRNTPSSVRSFAPGRNDGNAEEENNCGPVVRVHQDVEASVSVRPVETFTLWLGIQSIARWLSRWRNGGNAEENNDNSGLVVRVHQEGVEGSVSERPVEPESKTEEEVKEEEEEEEEEEDDDDDEFYCCYDSTWEDEPSQNRTKVTSPSSSYIYRSYKFSRFQNAAKDMQNYRHDYPNRYRNQYFRDPEARPNLMFYLGQDPCLPDGLFISDIHKRWYGDYNKLEYVHTYIQWLFPLQEPGVNSQASILTKQEITDFLNSDLAKQNLLKSYKLMLDFYGIELIDETTGKVRKTENWMERFDNLNSHTHNSLRITRILKCLGTLGYRVYQAPLVKFFLEETLVNGQLPNIKESVLNYFVFAVLDKMERRKLLRFAYEMYDPTEEFVWCPKKTQMSWLQQNKQNVCGGEGLLYMSTQPELCSENESMLHA